MTSYLCRNSATTEPRKCHWRSCCRGQPCRFVTLLVLSSDYIYCFILFPFYFTLSTFFLLIFMISQSSMIYSTFPWTINLWTWTRDLNSQSPWELCWWPIFQDILKNLYSTFSGQICFPVVKIMLYMQACVLVISVIPTFCNGNVPNFARNGVFYCFIQRSGIGILLFGKKVGILIEVSYASIFGWS